MRVTNEQIDAIRICHSQMQCSDCKYDKTLDDCQPTKEQFAADLLEARELIKEMREDLLKISQYPLAFVCEEARIIAREAWKKSMEVTE